MPLAIVPAPVSTFAQAIDAAQPVAYWRLSETANPSPGSAYAYDYYGGFTGVYGVNSSNAANGVLGPTAPGWPGLETNNGALETVNDETNSYVTVPALNLNTNAVTISMWIYPLGSQNENTGLFFWRGSSSAGLVYNGALFDNNLAYNWGNSATPYTWISQIAPPANIWSYVSLVVTPTNGTIYMMNTNGLASSSLAFANANMAFDGPSAIGTDPFQDARTFNGIIDEVSVYNRSLTQSQLNTIYIAGAGLWPGLAPDLVSPPQPETLNSGRNATFSVGVTGLAPFTYQWMTTNASGVFVPMTNGSGVVGVTNTSLTISNVSASTSTEYVVVVSNSYGVVTSSVASLTLLGAYTSPYEIAVQNYLPLAYWRLNETQNPNPGPVTAEDVSGNNFNGFYGVNAANAATGVSGPVPPAFPGFEATNGALETFNGETNSLVTVPALNLNTNAVTFLLWVYPLNNQARGTGVFFWRGSSTAGLIYNNLVGNNQLAFDWNNDSTAYNWQSGLVPPVNTWSLLSLVITPTNGTIYMINNSGLSANTLTVSNAVVPFNSPSTIGADPFNDGRTFAGVIDDVAVINQSLTEAQIGAFYTAAAGTLLSPIITNQPAPDSVYAGRTAEFTVGVTGATPMTFRWLTTNASGVFVPMTNGNGISGATNATLVLSNISAAASTRYEVVITNAIGAITSSVAALTVAPVATNNYEKAIDLIKPVAYWRLNETVQPNPGPAYAFDFYGGFTGTYGLNSSNAGNGVLGPVPPVFANFETTNGALETFNNVTNSYVTVPALNLKTNNATISMWIYPQGTQAASTGLFFWRGSNSAGFAYNGAHPDNNLAYNWGNNSSQYLWDTGVAAPTNIWSLVSLVVTPTNATVYVMNTNGLSSATIVIANPVLAFDSASAIGTDPFSATRTFNGIIDEVAVFNQSLSQSQLATFYLAGAGSWPALAPMISQEPQSRILAVGRDAQYTVIANGAGSLGYQWLTTNAGGQFVAMSDGPGISGSTTTTLIVSNVSASTSTQYEVVITNFYGSVTSTVATLTTTAANASAYAEAVEADKPVAYWRFNDTVAPNPGPALALDLFGGFSGTYRPMPAMAPMASPARRRPPFPDLRRRMRPLKPTSILRMPSSPCRPWTCIRTTSPFRCGFIPRSPRGRTPVCFSGAAPTPPALTIAARPAPAVSPTTGAAVPPLTFGCRD